MKPIGRHRLVNSCLEEELKTGVHALSIQVERPFGDHLNTMSIWFNSEDLEQDNYVQTIPNDFLLSGFQPSAVERGCEQEPSLQGRLWQIVN